MDKSKTTRRSFLATGAAVGLVSIVPRRVIAASGEKPPGEKLNIAGIGVGGMGASNLKNCAKENIVALCDVDPNYAGQTFAKYPT